MTKKMPKRMHSRKPEMRFAWRMLTIALLVLCAVRVQGREGVTDASACGLVTMACAIFDCVEKDWVPVKL